MNRKFYELFLEPSAKTDDLRRQEFILDLMLFGSCCLAAMAVVITFINASIQANTYIGTPPALMLGMFTGLTILYILSRCGYYRQSSIIFLGIIFIFTTYALLIWGIQLPQGILIYSLLIIMAGVLLSSKISFALTVLIFITLLSLTALKDEGVIKVDNSWSRYTGTYIDAVVYGATFILIAIVAWLSNRETEASLNRARNSEMQLRIERNMLEVKVNERTQELKRSQAEKINELEHFAEFGRLSSTLMHDLANPLTSVSIELEQLANSEHALLVKRAREGIESMEGYITAARKRLRNENKKTHFSVAKELVSICSYLKPLADMQKVSLILEMDRELNLNGDVTSFNQILTNLIVNSIDAYREIDNDNSKPVWVRCKKQKQAVVLEIEDKGAGIASEDIIKVFKPFYTTKPVEYGSGLGLPIVRNAVEKDFNGDIKIESELGKGTIITITLP